MSNIEIAMYVVFGMVAGWPILLLVLASVNHERTQQQWRVVDSVCKCLGVKE